MNIKKKLSAVAISAVLGMVAAGQASASTYALSHIQVDELNIDFTSNSGPGGDYEILPTFPSLVNNFNFDLANSASLNFNPDVTASGCSGSLTGGAPSGSCNPTFPGGSGGNTVLGGTTDTATGAGAGPNVVNAPGSTLIRAEDNYTFIGPGNSDYGNSDSVIYDAALVGDAFTHVENIAEANIQSQLQAAGQSSIQSVSNITFDFTVLEGTLGGVNLSFLADPDLRALVDENPPPELGSATAQADLTWRFELVQDTGGNGSVSWRPQGTALNDCLASAGITCNEDDDGEDLNVTVAASTVPFSEELHSWEQADVFSMFGLTVTGLTAGDWSLTLFESKNANVTQTPIPEPSILGLLGMSLFGLGFFRSRAKKRS